LKLENSQFAINRRNSFCRAQAQIPEEVLILIGFNFKVEKHPIGLKLQKIPLQIKQKFLTNIAELIF
jgi:hypothetical protein